MVISACATMVETVSAEPAFTLSATLIDTVYLATHVFDDMVFSVVGDTVLASI